MAYIGLKTRKISPKKKKKEDNRKKCLLTSFGDMSLKFNYSLISSNYNQMTLDWPRRGVLGKILR